MQLNLAKINCLIRYIDIPSYRPLTQEMRILLEELKEARDQQNNVKETNYVHRALC